MNAADKRSIALGMIVELYFPSPPGAKYGTDFIGTDPNAIADNIAKLDVMGRTDRWKAAIRRWAGMVRNAEPGSLRWAFLQGLIYAGHASN